MLKVLFKNNGKNHSYVEVVSKSFVICSPKHLLSSVVTFSNPWKDTGDIEDSVKKQVGYKVGISYQEVFEKSIY